MRFVRFEEFLSLIILIKKSSAVDGWKTNAILRIAIETKCTQIQVYLSNFKETQDRRYFLPSAPFTSRAPQECYVSKEDERSAAAINLRWFNLGRHQEIVRAHIAQRTNWIINSSP